MWLLWGSIVSIFVQLVGWFSLPVLAVLAGILVWRKIPRKSPHFFNYIVVSVLLGVVLLWSYYARRRSYASIYWISEILEAVFVFLATYELFVKRLFPRFYNIRVYQYLFPAAAIVITLFAVLAALQTHKSSILTSIIHVFDVLRVTMLLFLIGLVMFMGRQWKRYELGIAMGLVVEVSALLLSSASWVHRPFVSHLLDQLPAISSDMSSVIWLVTFLKPERPSPLPTVSASPEVLQEARKWQTTLKEALTAKKTLE